MHSFRTTDQKRKLNMNMTNNLDISSISNKSKNSVKDFFENRNHTPLERSKYDQNQPENSSKVKLMLNNLVQAEKISGTSLLGQSIKEKKFGETRSIRGDSEYSRIGPSQNFLNKIQQSKTPKHDSANKQQNIAPQSTRDDKKNMQNLYYMFQNKASDPQIKQNQITLSQLAKQHQQQRISNNTTPQKISTQPSSSQYLSQIQSLKQKIDNTLQNKDSLKTEKKNINNQILKEFASKLAQTQLNGKQKQENKTEIKKKIIKLLISKEDLWQKLLQNIIQFDFTEISGYCQLIQSIIQELSEKGNSEYLYEIDVHIIDTFLLESYTILILTIEYLKPQQQLDQNVINLVNYVSQSNVFLLQTININIQDESINLILELRQSIKNHHKGKQTLQKNNFIIRSIIELIHPEIYSQLGFNQNSLDIYYIQQKKILNYISKEFPQQKLQKDQIHKQQKNIIHNLLPQKPIRNYTLVLDLDETLVHYQEFPNGGGQFLVRPYAEEFIEHLSKYYEIVIFTAAQPDYANFIIDIIDKQQVITGRLYREHTLFKDNMYIKDLSILGRQLSKVIIVDNMPENFQLQPENGIFIQSWTGNQKDRALKDLMPLLEQIAIKKCKDVREALNQFREQMIQKVQQGIKNPYQNLQLI